MSEIAYRTLTVGVRPGDFPDAPWECLSFAIQMDLRRGLPERNCVDDLGGIWAAHRDEIIGEWIRSSPGTRPAGFWRYDAMIEPPEDEAAWLREHGELMRGEAARIGETRARR